jgi:hypothetical protein
MIAEKKLVASVAEDRWWGVLPASILNLITMKLYDFRRICSLGNLWHSLTHNFFPDLSSDAVLNATQLENCHRILEFGRKELNYVGLTETAKYVTNIRQKLTDGDCKTYQQYLDQVDILDELTGNEIEGMVFGFIPKDHGSYFQQDALFGVDVNEKIHGAKDDIREAGNCYAHGTYTACVYHLMRVSEFGLRRVAQKLRIKLTDKGKPILVEFATWDKVITGCKNKITAIRLLSAGPKRQAQLELYSDAADHCLFMKDIWRNNASHTRKPYSQAEALAVMGRVRDFMKFLAANVS